jgi:hypothetical protein
MQTRRQLKCPASNAARTDTGQLKLAPRFSARRIEHTALIFTETNYPISRLIDLLMARGLRYENEEWPREPNRRAEPDIRRSRSGDTHEAIRRKRHVRYRINEAGKPHFEVSDAFAKRAAVPSMEDYDALCAEADNDYEGLWARLAQLSDATESETCAK